jgi:hypothetical protein
MRSRAVEGEGRRTRCLAIPVYTYCQQRLRGAAPMLLSCCSLLFITPLVLGRAAAADGSSSAPTARPHPRVNNNGAATATCFGFNATDSTEILQAALSMAAISTLTIDRPPNGAKHWLVRPLYINRNNLALVLAPGVVVLAKQDAFHGEDDSLLKAEGAHNISILGGSGSSLRMRRADYAVPSWGACPSCKPYSKAEWRAGIWLAGCTNVTLAGLTVAESGGDGLFITDLDHASPDNVDSRDIHVHDCVFDNNYRQGLSLISVINLLVERCTFSNTNGTNPQAGVDLEPDFPSQQLTNVTFRDCSYTGNAGAGFRTCMNALNGSTQPVSVLFSGGVVTNNTFMFNKPSNYKFGYYAGHSIGASFFRPGLGGTVTYENLDVRDSSGPGLKVLYKAADGPLLTLRNISLTNVAWDGRLFPDPKDPPDTKRHQEGVGPIMFIGSLLPNVNGYLGGFPTVGGIVFDGVRINDNVSRPWLFVDTVDRVETRWDTITGTPSGGVKLKNKLGGCWVRHNRTNATSMLPFSAVCSE